MKVKRMINGVLVEIELTHKELADAHKIWEHQADVDYVYARSNDGAYEAFADLDEREKKKAIEAVAWLMRNNIQETLNVEGAFQDACEEYFRTLTAPAGAVATGCAAVSKYYYSMEEQVNDCFTYLEHCAPSEFAALGGKQKNAEEMSEAELEEITNLLVRYFRWVPVADCHQLVPQHIASGDIVPDVVVKVPLKAITEEE